MSRWKKFIICNDTEEVVESYTDYLQTKHWKAMREKVYEEYNGICGVCGEIVPRALSNIHHRTYKRVGNEDMSDLILLCKSCHAKAHKRKDKLKDGKRNFGYIMGRCRTELSHDEKEELMEYIKRKYGITFDKGITKQTKKKKKKRKE